MRRPVVLIAGIALLATACAGPSTPINASLKSFPQKVRLGAALINEPAIAPVPPSAPLFTGGFPAPQPPALDVASPPPPVAPPPVAAPPCPKAAPGTTPLVPADATITAPPFPTQYAYRTAGKHTVGGSQAGTVDYPKSGARMVGPAHRVQDTSGLLDAVEYDVTAVLGTNRTVTTYRIVRTGSPTSQPLTTDPGLYVVAIATVGPDGKPTGSFHPQPAMLVMPFPADQGTAFHVQATDPATGTTMTYDGSVGPHVVVDACGQVIDTRSVTHTGAISIGGCHTSACTGDASAATTEFTATYDIAMQYGGLSVRDNSHVDGLGLDAPFTDDLSGVINTVPRTGKM